MVNQSIGWHNKMRGGEVSKILKPSVPYIELGGALCPYISTGWNELTWALMYFITSDFNYQADGSIYVYTTGIYRVDLEIGFKFTDTNAAGILQLGIFRSTTFPDVEVENSRSIGKVIVSGTATDYLQLSVSRTIFITAGESLIFKFNTDDASVVIADTPISSIYYSRVRLSYVPSGGYNNNACGSIINRGVRR